MTARRAFVVGAYRPSGGALMEWSRSHDFWRRAFDFDVTIVTLRGSA